MGFFSSILGGSSSSSSSGGFNQLPESIKGAYTGFGDQLQNLLKTDLTSAYTPQGFNPGEQSALTKAYSGVAPTAASINSDIGMQMNPYNSYVMDEINRQAGGEYSILKQALNEAGQSGSNRQMLGANDIDLSRTNQIGGFLQGQFDKAMQNAMTTLPGARANDISLAMGAGDAERSLGLQQNTAGITAMQELAKALGILPTAEGSTTSKSSSSNGIGGLLGSAAKAYVGAG